MSERVAVVTGAASGSGSGIAKRLAGDGHAVALLDLDGAAVEKAASELSAGGSRAAGYQVDVADRSAVERVYASVRQDLGPITIVVTSAGVEAFDPVMEITPEKWDRLIAVNLTGHLRLHAARRAGHDRSRLGTHRDHLLVERPVGRAQHGALRRVEGGRHRPDQGVRP